MSPVIAAREPKLFDAVGDSDPADAENFLKGEQLRHGEEVALL